MIIRRNDGHVPYVMTEDRAFELYLILKAHFEPEETNVPEAERD